MPVEAQFSSSQSDPKSHRDAGGTIPQGRDRGLASCDEASWSQEAQRAELQPLATSSRTTTMGVFAPLGTFGNVWKRF